MNDKKEIQTKEKAIEFGEFWLEMNSDSKDSLTYQFFEMAVKTLKKDIDASNEQKSVIEELENICSNAPDRVLELLTKLKTI